MKRLLALANRLPWRNVGSFAILQLAGAVVPLLVLPLVTRLVGAEGWVAFSIGYSIGGICALIINFGWPLRGPGLVAGAADSVSSTVFMESFHFRLQALIPVLLLGGGLTWLLTRGDFSVLAVLMTIAVGLTGLSPSWYFIGKGQPHLIALTDVGPRILASLAVVPLLLIFDQPWVYPTLLICAAVLAPLLANRLITGSVWGRMPPRSVLLAHGRRQLPVVAAGLILAGYGGFAVPLATLSGATIAAIASFAAATRLRSMAQVGIAAVSSGFQGWAIARVGGTQSYRRKVAGFVSSTFAGLLVGATFFLLAPPFTPMLLGPEVRLSSITALWAAIACVLYSMSSSLTHHVLAPLDKLRQIALSTTLAALIGAPLIVLLASKYGAEGAMFAVMAAEFVVVAVQIPVSLSIIVRMKRGLDPRIDPPSIEWRQVDS